MVSTPFLFSTHTFPFQSVKCQFSCLLFFAVIFSISPILKWWYFLFFCLFISYSAFCILYPLFYFNSVLFFSKFFSKSQISYFPWFLITLLEIWGFFSLTPLYMLNPKFYNCTVVLPALIPDYSMPKFVNLHEFA